MELTWFRDFVALAEEGSFSRAARQRNVTQPAFSRRVKALEDWVGAPLFNRTTQGVTLTSAGKAFAAGAPALLKDVSALRERARELGERAQSSLQFAATQTLSFTFFPSWIRALGERFEIGPVQLNAGNMAICEEIMRQGEAHFLLCHAHEEVADPFEGELPSVQIGADRLLAVGAPCMAHLFAEKSALPVLAYSAQSGLGRIVAACEPDALRARRGETVFSSHLAAALRSLACDGRGVAWLPESLVEDDLKLGRLRRLLPEGAEIGIEIRLFRAGQIGKAAEDFWERLTAPHA